jgi:multiple RNA-binding domain-containing protein 1
LDIPALPADQEPRQDDVSDLEWMKQRMSKNVDVVEKAFEQSDDEGESHVKETNPFFLVYVTLTL